MNKVINDEVKYSKCEFVPEHEMKAYEDVEL